MGYDDIKFQKDYDNLLKEKKLAEAEQLKQEYENSKKPHPVKTAIGVTIAAGLFLGTAIGLYKLIDSVFMHPAKEIAQTNFIEEQVAEILPGEQGRTTQTSDIKEFEKSLESRTDSLLGSIEIAKGYAIIERKMNGNDATIYFEKGKKMLFDAQENGTRLVIAAEYNGQKIPEKILLRYADNQGNMTEKSFSAKPNNGSMSAMTTYFSDITEFLKTQQKVLGLEPGIFGGNSLEEAFDKYIITVENNFADELHKRVSSSTKNKPRHKSTIPDWMLMSKQRKYFKK